MKHKIYDLMRSSPNCSQIRGHFPRLITVITVQ